MLTTDSPQTNLAAHNQKPYVVLISLDGYRWDYTKRFQPPHLSKFIKGGVQAESMIPVFPSKTFPNHYSIATGMYPENNGLVNNSFYDAEKDLVYKIGNRPIIEDGTWYDGKPLWVNAAQAGMVTASFFFVGAEADIEGVRPTYYYRYDGSISNEERVAQVLDWLKMPTKKRPHLITAYFSDMDDTGHLVGPNDDEALNETLTELDKNLGRLFSEIQQLDIPVNVIIVSDHGMAAVPVNQLLPLESIKNDALYRTVSVGAIVHLYLKEKKNEEAIFQDLKSKENHFKVYRTQDGHFYKANPTHPRLGELLVIPDLGWYFKSIRQIGIHQKGKIKEIGHHGFDPSFQDLHAVFYANGPAFKKGLKIKPFENIHIYPMICQILGLEIPEAVDGDKSVLMPILK